MILGIVLGAFIVIAVPTSIVLLVRDMRGFHRAGRSLADGGGDASGVSAAGMVWQSNAGAR